MSNEYHYESGAIHDDKHQEIHIGHVTEKAMTDLVSQFLKNNAEEADYEEFVDSVDEKNVEKGTETEEKELNYFAPQKNLQELLCKPWFDKFSTDNKYTEEWKRSMISDLMKSEWRQLLATEWGTANRQNMVRGYIVGMLKDVGVLKGSYDAIARETGVCDNSRTFSRYMSEGKNQQWFDWIKGYLDNQ